MLSYVFTENAMADITKQALYYEETQIGLGIKFMDAVTYSAEEIVTMPNAFVSLYKSTRERKVKKFPFKLIYTLEDTIVYIHAVYPSKANPENKYKGVK